MMCHFHFLSFLPQIKPVTVIPHILSSWGGGEWKQGAFNPHPRTLTQASLVTHQYQYQSLGVFLVFLDLHYFCPFFFW